MDTFHDGTLYGDPLHQASYEHTQTQHFDCVEMSAEDIIAQVTGQTVSEADITARAQSMSSGYSTDPNTGAPTPLYDPNSGTDFRDTPSLLAAYGVQSQYADDSTAQSGGSATGLDALENQLAAGHHVIASVDADTIWNALGIENQADPGHANHALVVTGIDTSTGTVYLNDSGTQNGAAEAVPIAVFEQAWATSGHAMVTTADGSSMSSDPLQVPGPSFGDPTSYLSPDPFASVHGATDPFGPSAGYTGYDDTRLLAAGTAGLAAAGAATLLHPRVRAAIGRARSQPEQPE